jgi:hypothetical protein
MREYYVCKYILVVIDDNFFKRVEELTYPHRVMNLMYDVQALDARLNPYKNSSVIEEKKKKKEAYLRCNVLILSFLSLFCFSFSHRPVIRPKHPGL